MKGNLKRTLSAVLTLVLALGALPCRKPRWRPT